MTRLRSKTVCPVAARLHRFDDVPCRGKAHQISGAGQERQRVPRVLQLLRGREGCWCGFRLFASFSRLIHATYQSSSALTLASSALCSCWTKSRATCSVHHSCLPVKTRLRQSRQAVLSQSSTGVIVYICAGRPAVQGEGDGPLAGHIRK